MGSLDIAFIQQTPAISAYEFGHIMLIAVVLESNSNCWTASQWLNWGTEVASWVVKWKFLNLTPFFKLVVIAVYASFILNLRGWYLFAISNNMFV